MRAGLLSIALTVATLGAQPAPDSPEVLLARAVERAGGAAALERARALAWEGDAVVHAGGRTVRIAGRWAVQPPDSAVVTTWLADQGQATARSLVLAAPRGWTVVGGRVAPMEPAMLANERDAFALYELLRLVPLRAPGVALAPVPPDASGQRGFRARRPGRPDAELYFDASGRLAHVRTEVHDPTTGGLVRQDAWLAGEVEGGGVRWPREIRLTMGGAPYFDLTIRALRTLPRLDDPLLAGPR